MVKFRCFVIMFSAMPYPMGERLAVSFYVTGAMRSGTTVTGQMLAARFGATYLGEVRSALWSSTDQDKCDCGAVREECPVWGPIFRQWSSEDSQRIRKAFKITSIPRILTWIMLRRLGVSVWFESRDIEKAIDTLRRLRNLVDDNFVDSGKAPTGILLWRLAGERLDVVQCMRAPFTVARLQADPGSVPSDRTQSYAVSLVTWLVYNGVPPMLILFSQSLRFARFRTLVRTPSVVLERIAASTAHRREGAQSFQVDDSFTLMRTHALVGNPRRISTGTIRVRSQ